MGWTWQQKNSLKHEDNSLKQLKTYNSNSPSAHIQEGLFIGRIFALRFGGLIFGRAYFWRSLLSEFYGLYTWSIVYSPCKALLPPRPAAKHRRVQTRRSPTRGFSSLVLWSAQVWLWLWSTTRERRNSYLKQNSCGAGMSYFTSVCLQKQPVAMGPWNLNKQLWSVYKLINSMMRV